MRAVGSTVAVSLFLLLPFAASAGEPPKRTTALTVYGNDPCPKATNDEIVVCAREPESERYRIPKKLRKPKELPGEASWASRVATLEDAARPGRPNSCSAWGSNGQTGCTQAMLRQWFAERRAAAAAASEVP